jgi:hypothetical protein
MDSSFKVDIPADNNTLGFQIVSPNDYASNSSGAAASVQQAQVTEIRLDLNLNLNDPACGLSDEDRKLVDRITAAIL